MQQIEKDFAHQGQQGEFIALDLTKKAQVQEAFTRIFSTRGRIDVLVNLQGGTLHEIVGLGARSTGIRVNAIAPGLTATRRVKGQYSPEAWAELSEAIPMGRTAEPEEVAEGVAFLVGEESSYITGQTLHVNGAMVTP